MSSPVGNQRASLYWDPEFNVFEDAFRNSMETEPEVSPRRDEPLAQPRAIGTSPVTELATRMEQMATGESFGKDLHNMGKTKTKLAQQDYFDPDLGYAPLSTNLTPKQEVMEKARCRDVAIDILGPAVMGEDSNNEGHGFYSGTIDNLETLPYLNITDGEFHEEIDSMYGKTPEQRTMVAEHPQKRTKISTEVSKAQATLQPSGSSYSKVPSFEDTENREVVDRKEQAQSRKGDKTTKNVFEAVARSQNPASPLKAASPVPTSSHGSWGNSTTFTFRPIAPRPSPQSSFEDAFDSPRGAPALPSQGFASQLALREHQRQESNQVNPPFGGPVQTSSAPAYGAGSPQLNQGIQTSANNFASPQDTRSYYVQQTPTHRRRSRSPLSSRGANMSEQNTPAQTPVTPTTLTTPTPRGLASLPLRPPGPLPSFNGPPIRQPNFSQQSPASTSGREFASITFPTRHERDAGIKLWQDVVSKEENRYKLWRVSHPRFDEMKVSVDLDPESTTIELNGPMGSNVRGALSSVFGGRHQVSARLG